VGGLWSRVFSVDAIRLWWFSPGFVVWGPYGGRGALGGLGHAPVGGVVC
jgi:hypothetical protein